MPQSAALLKRLLDDVRGQTVNLDINLNSGDTLLGTCYLKVHIAVEVLNALDIGEGGLLTAVGDQTAGNTGNRCLDRNTGVHQSQRGTADRALRGGAVGGNNPGNQTQSVRELAYRRDNRQQSTLSQCAVTDLTTAAPRDGRFANRERRKL